MDCGVLDSQKLNQVAIAAAVEDVAFLLEQIRSTSPDTWYETIELANAFFWYLSLRPP